MTILPQTYNTYQDACLWGMGRGAISLLFEHPLEVVKTRLQANPKQTTLDMIRHIFQSRGWLGFYTGAIPNGCRLMFKQSYRWPMMVHIPLYYESVLPISMNKEYPTLPRVLTALTIAVFETLPLTPLERLKVYLMTSSSVNNRLSMFFKENSGKAPQELTRGINAVLPRQIVAWVSFFVAEKKFKDREKRIQNVRELSFLSLLKVSLYVGIVNTVTTMPFDAAKTQLQQANYITNEGTLKTMRKIVMTYGVRALWAGWKARMVQYMIQSAFTVPLLDLLEKRARNQ